MYCKYSPKSREEIIWRHYADMLENNLLICCLVLADNYGFGKKRISDFLLHVIEKVKVLDGMIADDVIKEKRPELMAMADEDKIREIIKDRIKGIMPQECWEMFYVQKLTDCDVSAAAKRAYTQPKVSVSEAARLQNTMLAFRDYGRDKTK